MRNLFKVVTKAAIYNADKSKVIVIHMDQNDDYGLPGGHIEENETIEQSIARELKEECGVSVNNLKRTDFFMHANGKVVLAFTGSVDEVELNSGQDNLEGIPTWLTKEEFSRIEIDPSYRELVINNFS